MGLVLLQPGIIKLADVESELFHHHIEAGNTLLCMRLLQVHLIVTVIAEKEIRN